ncbi:Luciferase-like monooxygenase [Quadrisphaera granulorum]|uniref:Luciferase-like monooxygenase n=1 Tax=Quadrisphaera granulorum TaxID=317664 RepID=A0A316A4D2_9ACTN|nr:LLM class flavin-dependent oxidoreductase [Quadrisphaera granulorum]PWJ52751.1 luciferase-like monooxygenase [Quadrisphaera granulorum]SZE97356.1 Luciferase-like monooxygenase [Quadrisphaera granulorum]
MRIGAILHEPTDVQAAADAGLFALLLEPPARPDPADTGCIAAAEVASRTRDCRVVVRLLLGTEHPVTLAEEVAVLDHLSKGRVVVLVDPGELDDAAAAEDIGLLRACWSGRPVRHTGARWTVPSGIMAEALGPAAPKTLAVTPCPAQVDLPVWTSRAVDGSDAPVLAERIEEVDARAQVAVGVAEVTGNLEQDRELVRSWADAGATHLLLKVPTPQSRPTFERGFFTGYIARHLQPEVSMPAFPRIMAESALPAILRGARR